MTYSEKSIRDAILHKNEKTIAQFCKQHAEIKLEMFKLPNDIKDMIIQDAVNAGIKGYLKFSLKKKYANAISYIERIVDDIILGHILRIQSEKK